AARGSLGGACAVRQRNAGRRRARVGGRIRLRPAVIAPSGHAHRPTDARSPRRDIRMTAADRWRWRGSVAMLAVCAAFVIYPLIEQGSQVINSDWPAFATGARLIATDPGHLYDL